MKTVAIVASILLLAGPCLAQTFNWDENLYGFYFDEAGTTTSTTAAIGETVTAYLVLTNLNFTEEAVGWHVYGIGVAPFAGYPFDPIWPFAVFTWSLRHGGVDAGGGFGTDNLLNWVVSYAEPVLIDGTTVLADLQIYVPDAQNWGIYDFSGYLSLDLNGGGTQGLGASTYPIQTMLPSLWLPATINSDHEPVSETRLSWGSVKGLYR